MTFYIFEGKQKKKKKKKKNSERSVIKFVEGK